MSDSSLHAVLIQVTHDTLLLPNAAVAEVATLDQFEAPEEQAPGWLAGWHATPQRRVPVMFFEVLRGGPRPDVSRRGRVVIIHPLSSATRVGHYAIYAQAQPQLISLDRSGIRTAFGASTMPAGLVLTRVSIGGQDALIPDLEALEAQLAKLA